MDSGDELNDKDVPTNVVRLPLPAELPLPRDEESVAESPEPVVEASLEEPVARPGGGEDDGGAAAEPWWASPPPPVEQASAPGEDGAASGEHVDERPHGDGPQPEPAFHDSAAYEIGAHIGEAISAHLPSVHEAGAKRGLDLRWMRLKYNVPAMLIALLVTWGGRSPAAGMVQAIREGGLFAPLGWVLVPVAVVGLLMVLPVGGALGQALSHLVIALTRSLVAALARAWALPYTGYVLRLLVAVFCWAFAFAVLLLAGRAILHLLTGA